MLYLLCINKESQYYNTIFKCPEEQVFSDGLRITRIEEDRMKWIFMIDEIKLITIEEVYTLQLSGDKVIIVE